MAKWPGIDFQGYESTDHCPKWEYDSPYMSEKIYLHVSQLNTLILPSKMIGYGGRGASIDGNRGCFFDPLFVYWGLGTGLGTGPMSLGITAS